MGRIVLASASPRRLELLHQMGITDIAVMPSACDERVCHGLPPGRMAATLARMKAESVHVREGDTVIGADTVVVCGGRVLGKPDGREDARRMLDMLSGQWHEVFTGVYVRKGEMVYSGLCITRVQFHQMSAGEINAYIGTGDPMDKAGAYGIQGRGCVFIRRIEGDYYNVMGLPVSRVYQILKDFGSI